MNRSTLGWVRVVYLVIAGAGIAWLIANRRDEIRELVAGTRPAWLIAAFVASFALLLLGALVWNRLLTAMGVSNDYVLVLHATARSVLARYIPGSVWFAVGRATLLSRFGVPVGPLTATAVTEILLSMATTIGVGALILGIQDELPGGTAWALGAAVVIVVAATPPLAGRVIAWVAARRGATVPPMRWSTFLGIVAVMVAFWGWSAVTFSLYLEAFPSADGLDQWTVVGGFLFAWGVGFLALFAPQGLGVFEVTLASILVADGGIGAVAVVIGGYRVVMLARDALAALVAELTAGRVARRASAPTAAPPGATARPGTDRHRR